MPKNESLPGMEAPKIKEIEKAAEKYVEVRDQRMALTEKEVTAKANLIQVVMDHADNLTPNEKGQRCYRYDDMIVILKPGKANVKVKHWEAEDAADQDED